MDQEFREDVIDRLGRIESKLEDYCSDTKENKERIRKVEIKIVKLDARSSFLGILGGALALLAVYLWKVLL